MLPPVYSTTVSPGFSRPSCSAREMTAWANQAFSQHRGHAILVERAANGPALIATLRNEIPSLIPITAHASKTSRTHSISPQLEAGNIWLPGAPNEANTGYDRTLTPAWVEAFIEEFESFPRAANDDQIDAATQAIQRLSGSDRAKPAEDPETVDHNKPPSRWITEAYRTGGKRDGYVKARDAVKILVGQDLEIAARYCSQFKAFLNTILDLCGGTPIQ